MRSALVGLALALSSPAAAQDIAWDALPYEEEIVGGRADSELPLIVALHPWGGSPRGTLRQVQRALPEGLAARLVAPRGPLREGRGRAWIAAFAADPDDALSAALAPAAAGVAAFIGALRERVPTAGRPIVVGISQGGLVALALAARDPHAVGAVFVLGATLPRGLWPRATPSDPPRVWGWHGARDRYVPLRRTEVAFAAFRRRGYGAELEVDERRGHRFDGPARGALRVALARFVDASVRDGGAAGRAPRRGRGPRDALGRAGGHGDRPREGRAGGSGASR